MLSKKKKKWGEGRGTAFNMLKITSSTGNKQFTYPSSSGTLTLNSKELFSAGEISKSPGYKKVK